jgi:hypothetical protein
VIEVWRLVGARQAEYGIGTENDTLWLTLKESFGERHLSYEYGRGVVQVDSLDDDATPEQKYDRLAGLEGVRTWREQVAWLIATFPEDFENATSGELTCQEPTPARRGEPPHNA